MSLFNFKKQIVRDLAWVMRSPGLVSPPPLVEGQDRTSATKVVADISCRRIYERNLDWIVALENRCDLLSQWIKQSQSHRLGYYFESLVEFWLQHRVASKALSSHVQVANAQRTLGEFDFVFNRELSEISLHWEVAIKFYLHYIDSEGSVHWLGPNGQDSLETKLNHLQRHQLLLAQTHEGRTALHELGFDQVRSELFLKGYLFYPLSYRHGNEAQYCAGLRLSSCHLKGWWCRYPNLQLPQIKPGTFWRLLDKSLWLSPACLNNLGEPSELLTVDQVVTVCEQHFAQSKRSLLFAEMVQAVEGRWQEVKRGFVVHPDWPFNRARIET
ncbi:MAG: DUF1853 family protein [Thiohalomonadales bacterium]